MNVGELKERLANVHDDIPIRFMGVEGVMYLVTGEQHDYVIVEESIKTFCESHNIGDPINIEINNYAIKL